MVHSKKSGDSSAAQSSHSEPPSQPRGSAPKKMAVKKSSSTVPKPVKSETASYRASTLVKQVKKSNRKDTINPDPYDADNEN
ncbi:uncharacterized protein Bfra_005012 [Botrytis fragariae]|uniref:Uncharacterized protein n=1 Tax=Botrytis fragariae TaxID=1964551 RepID=A0A8H6ATU5_9HELO|nr:uncharacterized protein Bfra_005012 [Botrytis fragariae]KAF5873549.1 hypothetical protein Bfra_005012 [Botrytis fragariae]